MTYADISDVSQGKTVRWQNPIPFSDAPSRARRLVSHNDTLLSTVRTYLRAVTRVDKPPSNAVVSTGFAVIRPHAIDARFLGYALQSDGFIDQLVARSVGVSYPAISPLDVGKIKVPVPNQQDQVAIADYLDHETATIDAFVSDTLTFAKLAAERSAAQYAQWLTRGTRSNSALTEEHEVDWLQGALIPEHWESVKLGLVSQLRSGDAITAADIEPSGKYPVYGGGGLRGYTSTWTHREDQVMFGRQGALCGQVFRGRGPLFATEHAVVVQPTRSVDLKWLESLLRYMNLGQYSTSAAQPGLSVDDISKLKIIQPPLEEQRIIAENIARDELALASIRKDFETAINLARERRAALISTAVTGQLDVSQRDRSAADQLEEEVLQRA
ncbi:restriction endonuclease subunit S [Nesterenkonia jeotgali]|uniref:Type I restriction enzyme S subunit n=1 Tax=Nesterenkonia jeotgali TaxID=317018 RepID=A0A839FKX3_9MICC|nr:restriction endonuclease subunit S [Nesterenkonia jeotgali]MBA8922340.1 type I restriction enzyme S subunit [Nesterenkonia jeotgali]